MAVETMQGTHGLQSIVLEGAQSIESSDYEIRTLAVGSNTAKVGDLVTENGETSGYVDLAATGDGSFLGVIIEPVYRPSDTWDIDDALIDGTKVRILKPTGGRTKIAMNLIADVGGSTLKAGTKLALATAGAIKAFAYTDGAVATDTLKELVGSLAYELTLHDSGSDDTTVVGSVIY